MVAKGCPLYHHEAKDDECDREYAIARLRGPSIVVGRIIMLDSNFHASCRKQPNPYCWLTLD
jgi:hypothetical protein